MKAHTNISFKSKRSLESREKASHVEAFTNQLLKGLKMENSDTSWEFFNSNFTLDDLDFDNFEDTNFTLYPDFTSINLTTFSEFNLDNFLKNLSSLR